MKRTLPELLAAAVGPHAAARLLELKADAMLIAEEHIDSQVIAMAVAPAGSSTSFRKYFDDEESN